LDETPKVFSRVGMKTINNQSLLGTGNIEIQGSGDEQVQSDWNETDTTSPAYIQNKPDIQSIEGSIADVQNDIDNLEDDIAAQQAEISGIQTVVSGHQTAIQNQNSEISGIQSVVSGHQTAIQNQNSEISGIQSDITSIQSAVENLDTEKQDKLESGVNIKTVNGESILGEGNITIESGADVEPAKIVVTDEEVQNPEEDVVYIVQKPINLKTINGEEIVGEGNIVIESGGGTQVQSDWNETDTTSPAYIQNKPDITSIEGNIADVQNDIDNLEDDIAAQQAEISGVQTAISGHQTAIQNQATEISGMQTNISGMQTVVAGHQTAIQNQASEISGMQTVLAGHQTALENQSGGGDPGFIKVGNGVVSYNSTGYDANLGNRAMIQGSGTGALYAIKASGSNSHAEGEETQAIGYNSHAEGQGTTTSGGNSHAEGRSTKANGTSSHAEGHNTITYNIAEHAAGYFNTSTQINYGLWGGRSDALLSSIGNGNTNAQRHNAFEVRQNGDIYYSDTEKIDGNTVHYYDAPMRKLQDAMVTSTTSGLKIEVVSALPATPDANTIYIIQ
jgi:predicted  nucleic acid-binding Zn-ribbon protein